MNTNLLINNKSVTGEADPYQVINPFNSEIIAEVNQSSIDQVNLAVQAAKDAFPKWSRTSPGERSSMLLKLADAIDSKAEEIAKIESLNTGKPFHLALNDELPAISDVFRYYAGACRNMPGMGAGEYMSGFTSMIRRDPIGVVAISYGSSRIFRIRDKKTKTIVNDFYTENNSILHMGGDFQKEFTHEIPIEKGIIEPRYSFTFRKHKN